MVRNITSFTKVHLIGRLALERRMGNDSVVLVHVEGCLLAHVVDRIEIVQVQPPVLQHSPPRFDHAVREYDVDLGQDALDRTTALRHHVQHF